MKLFVVSDIHGATKPIDNAASLIREADWIVISGDITHTKTRAEAAGIERFQNMLVANSGSFKKGRYLSIEIGSDLVATPGRVDY